MTELEDDAQRLARHLAGRPLSWWAAAGREAAVRHLLATLAELGARAEGLAPRPFLTEDFLPVTALPDMLLVLVGDLRELGGDGAAALARAEALAAVRRARDQLG